MALKEITNNKLSLFLSRFLAALRFLTIIPVSWRAEEDSNHFHNCLLFFPVIGALIGAVGYLITHVLLLVFPPQVVTVFAIIYLAFISGCLHLDGLADSADGLLSSRPRKECLRIMKDSRTGAMGVIAVVCLMLAKYGALSSLTPGQLCLVVFFMPLAGRSIILFSMSRLQYAREEGGLGLLFYSDSSKNASMAGLFLLFLLFLILAPSYLLFSFGLIMVTAMLFIRWCRIQLGGATGDTLGAICELTEMMTAISFTASFSLM